MSNLAKRNNASAAVRKEYKLSGAEKGLLFLLSLEESVATRIMSHLSNEEVAQLRVASERLNEIDAGALAFVYEDFVSVIQNGPPTSLKGSGAYLRRLVGKAFGEGRATELFSAKEEPKGLMSVLSNLDTAAILGILKREHPQTIAVILSQLAPATASEILESMSTDQQAAITMRIAKLNSIPDSVIAEIERQFSLETAGMKDSKQQQTVDGIKTAAGFIKRMNTEGGEALIEELSVLDAPLAEQLRRSLFTFEDLIRVDSRGMQVLLREISSEQLVLALKSASEEIKDKVFSSVSTRAAKVLRDELDIMGPVRISDVEQAQEAIVEQAMQLEKDGRLNIAREGESDFV